MAITFRIALATTLLCFAQLSAALGLGSYEGVPRLGAPLAIDLPIAGTVADPQRLRVDVPDHSEHARFGAPEPVLPRDLTARVVSGSQGRAVVRLETRQPVMEPVLRFVVRIRWSGGENVRGYELLLDPATYSPGLVVDAAQEAAPLIEAGRPRTNPASTTLSAATSVRPVARAGQRYGPVAFGDTLASIVRRAYAATEADLALAAERIVAANPGAFAGGDPDRLMQGAWIDLPAPGAMASLSGDAAAVSAVAPAVNVASGAGTTYGPVRSGETLYSIARRVSGAPAHRVRTIAQRIHAANPAAFIAGDMDRIKAGVMLEVGEVASAGWESPTSSAVAASKAGVGPAASADVAAIDAAAIVRMREVLERERERTRELKARLEQVHTELAALKAQEASLSREIERKRVELARKVVPNAKEQVAGSSQRASDSAASPVSERVADTAVDTDTVTVGAAPARLGSMLDALAHPGPAMLTGVTLVLLLGISVVAMRWRRSSWREAEVSDAEQVESIRERLEATSQQAASHDAVVVEFSEPESEVIGAHPSASSAGDDNVAYTDSARANQLAKQAAVSLAYEDYSGSKQYIEGAIELEPHRDEHKMVLLTLHQCMGDHAAADALIEDLISRREQLSGKLRAHVEELSRRRHV